MNGSQDSVAGPAIDVVGMACHQEGLLSRPARQALERAQCVIGARWHLQSLARLDLVAEDAERLSLPRPLAGLAELLASRRSRRIVILASGDPLFFGIGAWLRRQPRLGPLRFHSNVSSLQAVCARLGLPWEDLEVVSLHGRPLSGLRGRLRVGRHYGLLTDRDSSPWAVARELCAVGLDRSQIWVAEELGTAEERLRSCTAVELADADADLQSLESRFVMVVRTEGTAALVPEFPGWEDTLLITDGENGEGMISKREVRLTVLSLLQPRAGELGWDIGAGCGGVAVEWARWNRRGQVHALEPEPQRMDCLAANRERFGVVANLHLHQQSAPAYLGRLPAPDAVFIGGSGGRLAELLVDCWRRLPPCGRLAATAVTPASRDALLGFAAGLPSVQVRLTELAVSRGRLDEHGQWQLCPRKPVLVACFERRRSGG